MKTFIEIKTLKVLAKSKGCKFLDDVEADIKELNSSESGQCYVWIVSRNGTFLQNKDTDISSWFDRYSRSSLVVYELTIESFDELSIRELSLDQAKIDLKIAA